MAAAPRSPLLAGILSFIIPGLGQVYNGEMKRGIIFFGGGCLILFCSSLVGLPFSFYGLIVFILIALSCYIFVFIDAVRTAMKFPIIQLRWYNRWYIYLLILLTVVIIDPAHALLSIQAYSIPSSAMEPNLIVGDYAMVNKFSYGIPNPFTNKTIIPLGKPQKGDVVVFSYPLDSSKSYIKRIIGRPGDRVQIIDKRLYLNGQLSDFPLPLDDSGTICPIYKDWKITPTSRDNFGPVVVPRDAYFVLGDNRDKSYDSRFWGFVRSEYLLGKAVYIYFSMDPQDYRIRWNRIGKNIY